MPRRALPLLLLLVASAAGCRLEPEGRCDVRADCPSGLDCLNGVCAVCRSDLDCASHTACSAAGLCELRAGRCWGDADCPTWDLCDAGYTCVLRADHCADTAACTGALQLCDPEHDCSLEDGRCFADADCHAWLAGCDTGTNRCRLPAVAGEDVLAVGTLVDGACDRGAISRATTAAASAGVELGLGCGSALDGVARMDPVTGGVVYRHAEAMGGDTLRRFRKDALTWDATARLQRFPADASANDDFALVPGACPVAWDRWVMQAGTGQLLYACPVGGEPLQRDFYGGADVLVLRAVQEVLSWNAGGHLLVVGGDGALEVAHDSGAPAPVAVTGLPLGTRLAVRATSAGTTTADGFRVALRIGSAVPDELWEIDAPTGAVAKVGTYAAVPAGYSGGAGDVLDEAGALYGVGFKDLSTAVIERPLSGTATVVYAEASSPSGANDFGVDPFKPFLRLERILVTRP